MFAKGLVEEVKELSKKGIGKTASQALGIKEVLSYLKGEETVQEAENKLAQHTRNFAKRQLTWFKKDKRIEWIDIDGLTPSDTAKKIYKQISVSG